jgi:predicted metal-dependent HD superfamily phosphohydrolase
MIELLTKAYSEPHRKYHTLDHIIYMFNKAKEYKVKLTPELIHAIWFHDAVYDTKSKLNEENSSEEFCRYVCFSIRYSSDFIVRVRTMILDTKNHLPTTGASMELIDLDLSILGESDTRIYLDYINNVYKEYFPKTKLVMTENKKWKEGRIKFIETLLKRKIIFYTPWGKKYLEKQARKNLERELSYYH